jgi:hypothetical protein
MKFVIKGFLFLFLFLLFSECEKEDIFIKKKNFIGSIPINFRTYVQDFINDAENFNIELSDVFNVKFRMAELDSTIAGTCNYSNNEILINSKHWYSSPYSERKRIIYHELGHCALNQKEHRDDCFENRFPKSIMISKENKNGCFSESNQLFFCEQYSAYYLEELFRLEDISPKWSSFGNNNCTIINRALFLEVFFGNTETFRDGQLEVLNGEELFYLKSFKEIKPYQSIEKIFISDCIEIGDLITIRIRLSDKILITKTISYDESIWSVNLFN